MAALDRATGGTRVSGFVAASGGAKVGGQADGDAAEETPAQGNADEIAIDDDDDDDE